jgi:hypothetical protein
MVLSNDLQINLLMVLRCAIAFRNCTNHGGARQNWKFVALTVFGLVIMPAALR